MLLEVACFNTVSAVIAVSSGAQRIELCTDRASGGLTPTRVEDARSISNISGPSGAVPINVMVRTNKRPDFTVSDSDFEQMKDAILEFKPYASGFVFGILRNDGSIDIEMCKCLVDIAAPLPCTFHRAFDLGKDSVTQRARLVRECGFVRILSSGGVHDAVLGKERLKVLVQVANELGIEVIVGGGVRSRNIVELMEATGAHDFHTAAILSDSEFADADEIRHLRSKMGFS